MAFVDVVVHDVDVRLPSKVVSCLNPQTDPAGATEDVALDNAVDVSAERHRDAMRSSLEPRQFWDSAVKGAVANRDSRGRSCDARVVTHFDQSAVTGRWVHGKYRRAQDRQLYAADAVNAVYARDMHGQPAESHRLGCRDGDRPLGGAWRGDDDGRRSLAAGLERQPLRNRNRLAVGAWKYLHR